MTTYPLFEKEDSEYLIARRRELHQIPGVAYDLDETLAVVKRELSQMGIDYTEEFGKSSIVGTIPGKSKKTIAFRADMDALPVREQTGLSYASRNEGKMHACGHDAHTAVLLCTCRVLKRYEKDLPCTVKVIFQPCEEGLDSGANMLVNNGVLSGVDKIIGLHCDNAIDAGHLGICCGASTTSRHCYKLEFFGKTTHAAFPHLGHDALAMAVKTYNDIQIMMTREIDPMQRHLCCIGALNAGHTDNVVAEYAEMKVSVRTLDMKLDDFIKNRIFLLARHAAEEMGGNVKVTDSIEAFPVMNDADICESLRKSADASLGKGYWENIPEKMSSEDFSFYTEKIPGCLFRMGTGNSDIEGCREELHSAFFNVDEDGLVNGSKVCVYYAMNFV